MYFDIGEEIDLTMIEIECLKLEIRFRKENLCYCDLRNLEPCNREVENT